MKCKWIVFAGALLAALACTLAVAQPYPAKPIRLVVPFPAGGATDVLARAISMRAAEKLGQAIVIDNRPGAGGTIGADVVAKAPPDGYTLLIATGSTHSIGPSFNPRLPYDVVRDFAPMVDIARTSGVMVVPATLGVRNLPEFITLLRANPGKYNFGSSGNGTFSHLSGELFKGQAGVFMTHIPYRGTGLVFTDMMAGQIHMLIDNFVTAQPHIKDGKLRVIGVTSLRRLLFAPDLPTLDEQGLRGFDVDKTGSASTVRAARRPRSSRASTPRSTRRCRTRSCSSGWPCWAHPPLAVRPSSWRRWWRLIPRSGPG